MKFIPKDKKIRIFFESLQDDKLIKHYIHPEGTFLNAYVRQLSANEQTAANAIRDGSAIQFLINHRNVKTDMFVEFRDKVYQMGPPDMFEFNKTDIKFIAFEVIPKEYDLVEWSDWL